MASVQDPSPDDVLGGRYRLESIIGEGGMGSVWCASHMVTGQRVALKLLHTGGPRRRELAARLLSEARAASAINHPNVVQILDAFEHDAQTPVIVMELLVGETLERRLRRDRTIDVGETARIVAPVCSALAAAHEIGIVHRDLKPENIFLAATAPGDTEPKVLDFGIAKVMNAAEEGITRTGTTLGTACYMSPEQGFGEGDVDGRADIWSLGVMLYRMLGGVLPIQAANLGQYLKRLMADAITPLAVIDHELPKEVTTLVDRMLQRDPADRPQDMGQVLDVLRAHTSWTEPTRLARRVAPPATAESIGAPTTSSGVSYPERGGGTRLPLMGTTMVLAVAAGLYGAFSLAGSVSTRATPATRSAEGAATWVAAPTVSSATLPPPASSPPPQPRPVPRVRASAIQPAASAPTVRRRGLAHDPPF